MHVVDWVEDTVTLPPIPRKIAASRSLTGPQVKVEQTAGGVTIQVPPEDRQAPDTIVVLELNAPVGSGGFPAAPLI